MRAESIDTGGRGTSTEARRAADHSPYLVERLLGANEENLFNHVKFHLVKQELDRLPFPKPKVLDVGCGVQASRHYLRRLGFTGEYFGIDYEDRFEPDAVVDLMNPEGISENIPWEPDVVLMLDVLEHLYEDPAKLIKLLGSLRSLVGDSCTFIFTLPQMYRLDRFKLAHLVYPEHKIRLTQREWRSVLEAHFDVVRVQGLGYLSSMPYLPMASRHYTDDNFLGKTFGYLRSRFFEWPAFKPADLWLSNTLGKTVAFQTISNDVMFVAKPSRAVVTSR